MSQSERGNTKKRITIIVLVALLIISLGTYFTIEMANAKTVKEQLELGNRYYQEQRYEEAIIAYEKVLEIDAKNVEARIGLAKSYEALQKLAKAQKVLLAGVRLIPKEPAVYIELADLYLLENNILKAISTLDDGKSKTSDPKIQAKLGSIAENMNLISDRKEVQLGHQANLKVIYEKTTTTETQNEKVDSKESQEIENQKEASAGTIVQTNNTNDNVTNDEKEENTNAPEPTEGKGSEERTSTSPTTEVVEVEADWELEPGDNGELSSDKGSTNVFTATKEGSEVVTATVGSIQKSLSLNTGEQVLESFEIVASVEKTTVGEEIQLKAIGKDYNGKEMEISPVWSISEGVGSLAGTEGTTNTFSSTEPGNAAITATVGDHEFTITLITEEEEYVLTKTVSGQGSVVADPSRTKFKKGESVALKAVPDKGWEFVSWNGTSNSSSTQTTILMDGNKKVTAVFKQTSLFYALNVSKTGEGTVSVSPKSSKYTAGSVVTATAQPASGWQFDHWEGHANGKNSTLKIVMNEEKSIRAVFTKKEQQVVQVNKPVEKEEPAKQEQPVKQEEPEQPEQPVKQEEPAKKTYSLTTKVNGEGSIQKSPSKDNYEDGTTVALTATPKEGWVFQKWTGDITSSNANVSVTMNGEKTVEAVFVQVGHVKGVVKNAETGQIVSDANIYVRKGENVITGSSVASTKTNAEGQYGINNLAPGNYTMEISKDGFTTKHVEINIAANQTLTKNETIMPVSQVINDFRVVLTWDEQPRDLDSHLTGPQADGNGRFHIYYGSKQYAKNGVTYAKLDVDDTSGYGPETITSFKQINGIYRYYIHNYSKEVPLAGSQARVELYKNNSLIKTFIAPASGTGVYWNVFEIDNGQLKGINAISEYKMD